MDTTVIGADIARLIQNSPSRNLPGSALAVLLKQGYPDFRAESFGCRNLREFIRKYAKDVIEAGRNGADIRYGVSPKPGAGEGGIQRRDFAAESTLASPVRKIPVETAVWKTFVSPSAPYRIFANRETGAFQVLQFGEPAPDSPWVQIPSCPPETHVQIAKEFIDGIEEAAAKDQLTKILGLDSWWNHFYFSARNFGVERQWSAFRRRRLREELDQVLKRLEVSPSLTHKPQAGSEVPAPHVSTEGIGEQESALRRVAMAVIRRLPDSDLREVWLPLGQVLDEIGEK